MANHAMLLVEGESDQRFFATLLKEMTLEVQVQPETPKSVSDKIFRNGINPLFQRFENIANPGEQKRFKPLHEAKAQLSTWLAWQEEPGISSAYAYYKALFDKEHPHFIALQTWLKTVFD